jgi:hypothetical protein
MHCALMRYHPGMGALEARAAPAVPEARAVAAVMADKLNIPQQWRNLLVRTRLCCSHREGEAGWAANLGRADCLEMAERRGLGAIVEGAAILARKERSVTRARKAKVVLTELPVSSELADDRRMYNVANYRFRPFGEPGVGGPSSGGIRNTTSMLSCSISIRWTSPRMTSCLPCQSRSLRPLLTLAASSSVRAPPKRR